MNIFDIWELNRNIVPFAVRKRTWSNHDIYVIVEKVVPNEKGYGVAFGYPTTNGVLNKYFDYDKKWITSKQIPNAGCFCWEQVSNVSITQGQLNDYEKQFENSKKSSFNKKSHVQKTYSLETTLTFGKYADLTVEQVLKTNPQYLLWANKNIDGFMLSQDVISMIENK